MHLKDKVCVVTGGASGIGEAVACRPIDDTSSARSATAPPTPTAPRVTGTTEAGRRPGHPAHRG